MNVESLKELLKQCKADAKEILAGKPKSFYLTKHIESVEQTLELMHLQHTNNMLKMSKEYERAKIYSLDSAETERCGFNSAKQKPEQLKEWADKAYANINLSLYENGFEQDYIIGLMKTAQN